MTDVAAVSHVAGVLAKSTLAVEELTEDTQVLGSQNTHRYWAHITQTGAGPTEHTQVLG